MGSGLAYQTLIYTILAFFLVSALLDISYALGVKTINDNWKPINASDPNMVSAGEFAVNTHDSQTQASLGIKTINDDWKPINPSDPDVVSAGEFAVETHDSQTQATLVYDHVVHCETKIDGGRNYNLTIAAKNSNSDPTVKNYIAFVIDRPYQNAFELKSFRGPI